MRDPGVGVSNDGSDNQGWKLYTTSLVTILVAGLFVIARLVTRLVRRNIGWDDVAIVASLASSVVLSIAIQRAVIHGYGMHKADLDQTKFEEALKWYFIALTPYKVTVCLNKISVILLYLRIFVSKSFRAAAFTLLFVIVGYTIGSIAATIFECSPIQGAWMPDSGATCIHSEKFWIAYAVLNITTDILVLVLPVWPILKLHLSLRDRLLLCGVFVMAAFVTIAAILRTTSVHNTPENRKDPTYHFVDRGVWTLLEANLGIIGACLPILKHPLTRLFPHLFTTTTTTTTTLHTTNHHSNNAATTTPSSSPSPSSSDLDPHHPPNPNRTATHNNRHPGPRFWRRSLSRHEAAAAAAATAATAGVSGPGERAGRGRGRDRGRDSDELRIVGGGGTSLKGSGDGIELEEGRSVSSLGGGKRLGGC